MAVDIRLRSSGVPRRMGAAAFTLASTVEQVTGGWNHRVVAVYGTEAVPAPGPGFAGRQVPPGPVPPGGSPAGRAADGGELFPTWSAVGAAFPLLTQRPVGGGYEKPPFGGFVGAGSSLPQDLVIQPQLRVRTGAKQGRVTTAPKARMRWVRQGG